MKQINWKIPVILLFVLISGGCYSFGTVKEEAALVEAANKESITVSALAEPEEKESTDIYITEALSEKASEEEDFCYVHICGAVLKPGVYQVPVGERIFRVVELAGGYTEDAAEEYLNLAAKISDGMKLTVPTREEFDRTEDWLFIEGTIHEDSIESAKLDLNTATKEQLMQLSGIGEAKAEAILKYRNEQGRFRSIEEIMNISGIKQAAFDKIKEDIIVLK